MTEYIYCAVNKNDNILDLGCGEGRDSIYLLDNGYDVLAVDYSINVNIRSYDYDKQYI